MLHDPSHIAVIPDAGSIEVTKAEKEILRRLAYRLAEISAMPVHKEKAKLWTSLNDLKAKRPMVWITEAPWHELNASGELTLLCENEWVQQIEDRMRKTIYKWDHFKADMIVSDFIACPMVYHSTDFGIVEDVITAHTDEGNNIYSRQFKRQLCEPEDIEKIKFPVITAYREATQERFDLMRDIFDGIMPVKITGQSHIWYTPWDYLIRWWGVEEAMTDLIERPEMVHDAYERMVGAWMAELDQFDNQNLLELDCNNTRIGSGGYGYVSELPGKDFDSSHVHPKNMWGCSNAQIFSSVSPDMHWEFAIEHDLKWLSRWGLTYYGCCEPLDGKIHLLRRIPNLRKISVSPWCNTGRAVSGIGKDYVMSRKPNPAIFAADYDEAEAEKQLREFLEASRGLNVEIIMKDISTVRYHPENLTKWEQMAMRLSEEYIN